MSGLFDPDEGCVEMSLSNAGIGAIGGSIAGLFKSSFYMGPKITGAPISKC